MANPFRDHKPKKSGNIEISDPTFVKEKRVRIESESTKAVRELE